MKTTLFLAAYSTALAAASPLGKRQSSSMPAAATPVTEMPGVSMASGGVMPSGGSSMAMPTASDTMMPSMSMSSSNSSAQSSEAYPCPDGYLLTYVETQMNYDSSLSDVLEVAGGFQNATINAHNIAGNSGCIHIDLNGTGGNDVGATRYLATMSGTKTEVLSQYDTDRDNIALQLVMNLTSGPLMAPNGAVLSNYSTVFQIYQNNSASMDNDTVTTGKLFCNFCAAEQATGMQAVLMNFNTALQNIQTLLMGGEVAYPNGQAMPSGMMSMPGGMMSSMMPSGMMSGSAMPSDMMSGSAMPGGMMSASGMDSTMQSATSMAAAPAASSTSA